MHLGQMKIMHIHGAWPGEQVKNICLWIVINQLNCFSFSPHSSPIEPRYGNPLCSSRGWKISMERCRKTMPYVGGTNRRTLRANRLIGSANTRYDKPDDKLGLVQTRGTVAILLACVVRGPRWSWKHNGMATL